MPRIFVDCDETLWRTKRFAPNKIIPESWIEFPFAGQRMATIARPSARCFLEALQLKYPGQVDVLTSGDSGFQSDIFSMHNLRHLVGDIFSIHEKNPPVLLNSAWVLVDDLPAAPVEGIINKFRYLGIDIDFSRSDQSGECRQKNFDAHLITCRCFNGDDDVEPLTGLLVQVERCIFASSKDTVELIKKTCV